SFAPAGPCSDPHAAFVRRPPASGAEAHQAQASAGERSWPRLRPALSPSAAAAWLRTPLISRGVGGRPAGNNPIHALSVRLLRLQPEPELLAQDGGQEGAHRVRLPVREGAGCWPPGPSCVSPAPQLKTRMVSVARIRLASRRSPRLFKRIICDDVS